MKGLILKPTLQYFGHLMQRTDSLEKTLMLGKTQEEKGMTEHVLDKQTWWGWKGRNWRKYLLRRLIRQHQWTSDVFA